MEIAVSSDVGGMVFRERRPARLIGRWTQRKSRPGNPVLTTLGNGATSQWEGTRPAGSFPRGVEHERPTGDQT